MQQWSEVQVHLFFSCCTCMYIYQGFIVRFLSFLVFEKWLPCSKKHYATDPFFLLLEKKKQRNLLNCGKKCGRKRRWVLNMKGMYIHVPPSLFLSPPVVLFLSSPSRPQ